jgi:hypothetical protein
VNSIPGIEEVNIFKDDTVIHFSNPKGKAKHRWDYFDLIQFLICACNVIIVNVYYFALWASIGPF